MDHGLKHERVTFSSRDNQSVELEGIFHPVESPGQWPAAVVCHPLSTHGGSMYNKLVTAIAQSLADRGVLALRFNFRGVMRSGGHYDRGRGEKEDLAGALAWLLARPDVDAQRVFLVGYSFGAWVGLSHAVTDPRISAVVAIGLVPWRFDRDPNDSPRYETQFAARFLQSLTVPKLFVVGEEDDLARPSFLQKLVDRLPPPKSLHVLPGTDHFFQNREQEVADIVVDFLTGL